MTVELCRALANYAIQFRTSRFKNLIYLYLGHTRNAMDGIPANKTFSVLKIDSVPQIMVIIFRPNSYYAWTYYISTLIHSVPYQ